MRVIKNNDSGTVDIELGPVQVIPSMRPGSKQFELGKWYQPETGGQLHVVGSCHSHFSGWTLIAGRNDGVFVAVQNLTDDWYEIKDPHWNVP